MQRRHLSDSCCAPSMGKRHKLSESETAASAAAPAPPVERNKELAISSRWLFDLSVGRTLLKAADFLVQSGLRVPRCLQPFLVQFLRAGDAWCCYLKRPFVSGQ